MMTIRIIPMLLVFSLILPSVLPIVHADEETTVSSSDDTTGPKSTETATGSEEKKDVDASDADDAVVEKTVSEKKDLPKATSDETDVPVSGETVGTVSDSETKTGATPENTPAIEQSADPITSAPSTEIPATDTLITGPDTVNAPSSVETVPTTVTSALPDTESPSEKTSTPEEKNTDSPIILSEIQVNGGTGKSNNDFVELYNRSDKNVILDDTWGLTKRTGSKNDDGTITTKEETIVEFPTGGICMPPKGTLLWINSKAEKSYLDLKGPSDISNSKYLTNTNGVALIHNGKLIDAIQFPAAISERFEGSTTVEDPGFGSLTRDFDNLSWSKTAVPSPTGSKDSQCKIIPLPPVGTIVINELYPNPASGENEWIELRNTTNADISIAGWKLKDASTSAGYAFPAGSSLSAGGFLVIGADISKIALNNTGTESLTLLFPDETTAHSFEYAKTEKGASYAWDGHAFRLTHTSTPGEDNVFDPEPVSLPLPPIGTIRLNELFPNPKEKGEANEWIELRNSGHEPVSLLGWTLRSGSGKFTWTGKLPEEQQVIPGGGFLVLPRSLTRLALRNTNGAVTLTAPDGAIMDAVAYGKTSEGTSYGLADSGRFRFSKALTPGADNVFGKEPKAKKSDIPKKGYRGMLIPFSATGNKKGMKYVWDFGDGHKSYLDTTSHRFTKTGTYRGTLTLRDGIEEYVKPFMIKIGKYPNRNIHLTELCPNPDGTDTDREWVRIKNDDTKRIDLSGWIIASATDKTKLVNHVILTDRSIDPGEEITLTRADSRFTLPNERAVIELRRPDGKTVQTIEYFQDGGATENAVFTEIDDSVWAWSVPETGTDIPMLSATDDETESDDIGEAEPFEVGMSADPDSDRLSFGEFVTLGTPYDPTLPDSLPRVLGTSDDRLTNESSTSESFLDALFRILNGFATGKI